MREWEFGSVFHVSISALGPGVLVEHAVYGLDRWLRQRQGVYEFSDDPMCLFRVRRCTADCEIVLRDGTVVHPGDGVLDLHLWNEHVPPLGPKGCSMTWARQMTRRLERSLFGLAGHLQRARALDDIVALRADMRLGTRQRNGQLGRIAGHYGFEPAGPGAEARSPGGVKGLAENAFIGLLVLATNPVALRAPVFRRGHKLVYLSRAALETRYASASLLGSKRVGGAGTC